MKIIKNLFALFILVKYLKIFYPEKELRNKRVAVVGAADSVFEEKNGDFIDGFDIVIRINKAPHFWNKSRAEYIGKKFTFLFHSYYENDYSGGGPLDWTLYEKLGIKKVINPNNSLQGLNTHFSYYKRSLTGRKTYILAKKNHKHVVKRLEGYLPTVGYAALKTVLQSECKEIYLTGFTFFSTPYAKDYRKELENQEVNHQHIRDQGIHNPHLEFENFKRDLKKSRCKRIILDKRLQALLNLGDIDLINKK